MSQFGLKLDMVTFKRLLLVLLFIQIFGFIYYWMETKQNEIFLDHNKKQFNSTIIIVNSLIKQDGNLLKLKKDSIFTSKFEIKSMVDDKFRYDCIKLKRDSQLVFYIDIDSSEIERIRTIMF